MRRNRTHLVWNGAPSPALQRLIALLQDGTGTRRATAKLAVREA